jgi:hypothetical protein
MDCSCPCGAARYLKESRESNRPVRGEILENAAAAIFVAPAAVLMGILGMNFDTEEAQQAREEAGGNAYSLREFRRKVGVRDQFDSEISCSSAFPVLATSYVRNRRYSFAGIDSVATLQGSP